MSSVEQHEVVRKQLLLVTPLPAVVIQVIIDYWHEKIFKGTFTRQTNINFHSPFGVAVDKELIIVSEFASNRIQILNSRQLLSQRILGNGNGASSQQFHGPFGITIWNHELYIADYYNNRIQIWDYEVGVYLRTLQAPPIASPIFGGDGQINHPVSVVCTDDDVFIIEVDKQRISVCNRREKTGRRKRIIGEKHDFFHFSWQSQMYMCKEGFLYVSDFNRDVVKVLNPRDGEVIRQIGVKEGKHPSGIIVNQNYMYVAFSESHCISVFDLTNGQMVKNWGEYGKGEGKFQYPMGVNMTGNNLEFIVADYNNQRLQFFE